MSLRGGGLVAPAIRDADLPLEELMARLKDLVRGPGPAPCAGRADRRDDHRDQPGEQGVESVFGVIYPPQVALVGSGRVPSGPGRWVGCSGCAPA